MTVAMPGQTPAILGFVLPAGLGLVLAATLLLSYPPRDPPVEDAGTEMPAEDLTQIYIALEEPLFVSWARDRR